AAGGSPGELWTALDGADRLLDGGLSGAAPAGGRDAGRCAGPGNQFGEHSESLGGSQPGGRAALSAIARAVAARSSAERGRDGLAVVARLFRLWYRFRGDLRDRRGNPQPINRRQLLRKSIPLQKKLFALAETHLDHANKEVRNLATALYVHCERLFTFLEVKG